MNVRRYNHPDDAVRAWWRLTQRDESVPALDPFAMVGRVPARSCASCDGETYHEVGAKRGGFVVRCRRCGEPWRFSLEAVVKGTITIPRASASTADRSAVIRADLSRCIERLPESETWVYGLYLASDRSYDDVAVLAREIGAADPEAFPSPGTGWTPKRVRGAVARSRRRLEGYLAEAGLMARLVTIYLLEAEVVHVAALEPLPRSAQVPVDLEAWGPEVTLEDLQAHLKALRDRNPTARSRLLSLGREAARGVELSPIYREIPQ